MNVQDKPNGEVAVVHMLLRLGLCLALLGCAELKSGSDRANKRDGDGGAPEQGDPVHDGSVAMRSDGGGRDGSDVNLRDAPGMDAAADDGSMPQFDGSTNDAEVDAGAGDDQPDSSSETDECPLNFLCAEVGLPSDFSGTVRKVELRLEADPFVPGSTALPATSASYTPIDSPSLTRKKPYSLRIDFTQPTGATAFKGKRYAAIYVFRSTQSDAVPEIDYWFRSSDLQRFDFDATFELGSVAVERIPRLDDVTTQGNDAVGVVACGPDTDNLCDTAKQRCCCDSDHPIPCGCGNAECATGPGRFEAFCDGPEDCASDQVCCGNGYDQQSCRSAADCPEGLRNAVNPVCHHDEDCSSTSTCEPLGEYAHCNLIPVDDPETPGDDRPGSIYCLGPELVCSPGEHCCDPSSGMGRMCLTDAACTFGHRVDCDGPEDCPMGQSCCMDDNPTFACKATCDTGDSVVCHANSDCPTGTCHVLGGTSIGDCY